MGHRAMSLIDETIDEVNVEVLYVKRDVESLA